MRILLLQLVSPSLGNKCSPGPRKMERNSTMDGKWSKLPSIPPNFVTILQLQERWIKQQEQKQNKEQQPEPEPESKPDERVGIGDVVEECKSVDTKLESEGSKEKKSCWKKMKETKRQARALAAAGAKEGESDVAGQSQAPERKDESVAWSSGGRLRKLATDGGRGRATEAPEGTVSRVRSQVTAKKREGRMSKGIQKKGEWRTVNEEKDEEEVAVVEVLAPKAKEEKAKSDTADVADQTLVEVKGKLKDVSINGEKERGNDEPLGTNNGGHNRSGHRSSEKEARAKSGNEVLVDDQTVDSEGKLSYVSISGEKERGNDEPVGTNNGGHNRSGHRSGEKEETAKSGNDVLVDDQTVEIEGKLTDMPIKSGRVRHNGRPSRPNNGAYYRGGHRRFVRRQEEYRQRNAGMVWVKKGDGSAGNAGEVKSSSGGSINSSA